MANKFGFTSVNEQVNLGVSNNTGQVQDQIDLLNTIPQKTKLESSKYLKW